MVKSDISLARARRYKSSLEAALDEDNVPVSVYKNLITTVNANLAPLHKYYSIKKRVLALDELHHYDTYVPLVPKPASKDSYEEAVEIVRSALAPLGTEYTDLLCGGLLGGWCGRYPNKGKKRDRVHCCYDGPPFILLNYTETNSYAIVLMSHEGGHAMHSWYSARNNPFTSWQFGSFEAEVASTFNEELLFQYRMKNAKDDAIKKHIFFTRLERIDALLYWYTRLAEFALAAHEAGEAGQPLTCDMLRSLYWGLMAKYYGPEVILEKESDTGTLTCTELYEEAFYSYRYATGIAASLVLANKVMEGGPAEREAYFNFLKSGGSHSPLENLRSAGVDMTTSEPVQAACDMFKSLVDQLDAML